MLSKKLFTSIFMASALAFIFGCSGSNLNPVSQDINQNPGITGNASLIGVSDLDRNNEILEGMGALGLFSLSINPSDVTAELTPIRKTALNDVLEEVDITNFLTLMPCSDCVKIKSIALNADGNMVLSIGIKHPFPAGDPSKKITALNRADLHVFNVEGIVVSDAPSIDFPNTNKAIADLGFVNADGYTDYLDPSLDEIFPTAASIHPYKLHFDDYSAGNFNPLSPTGFESVTKPLPSGNLVMPMGSDYNYQDYIFSIDQPMHFVFAVGCTFGVSCTVKAKRFTPEYRVPQYNKKAADEVSVFVTSNDLIGGVPLSTAELEIHVVDINHNVKVGTALNEMRYKSSVDTISVDIPGISASQIDISGSDSISGSGHDSSDPLVYQVTLVNDASGHQGTHYGLVRVTDTFLTGINTFPPLDRSDGIKRVPPRTDPLEGLFRINKFETYQIFTIEITSECGPITGSILSPTCPVTGLGNGETVDFVVEARTENGGGQITLYEADIDYDGTTFTPDKTSVSGIFDNLGPFTIPEPCQDYLPYDFTVAFRAKDQCSPPNETIFATCTVTVVSCIARVENLEIVVNRRISLDRGIDTDRPWTLIWDPAYGAAEYAIYCDYDPSDGLDNDFQLVATIPSTTSPLQFDVPPEHLSLVSGWVKGNTYTVRTRSIIGDPLSEVANSEFAFIMTSCFDTLMINVPFGCPAGAGNTEGWKVALERTPYTDNPMIYYWPYVTSTMRTSDPNALSTLIYYLGSEWTYNTGGDSDYYPGHLVAHTVETPVVADSSIRHLEMVSSTTNGWDCDEEGGVIVGYSDSPIQPGCGWDGTDFHWVHALGALDGYKPYNYEHMSASYPLPFDMSEYSTGEKNCWKWRSG